MDARSENLKKKEQRFGNSGTLAQEVQTGFIYKIGRLPTPTANDGKNASSPDSQKERISLVAEAMKYKTDGQTSQLNPLFVQEMMGFPYLWTELPFQSGGQNPSKPTETQ